MAILITPIEMVVAFANPLAKNGTTVELNLHIFLHQN
jgi:hypothetical protein